jgi:hypothetical protein
MKHKPQCTQETCYCLDEELGDPMCDCGYPGYDCHCDTSGYWHNEIKTILVPIQITYHPPTDVLVSFELLSTSSWRYKVEQAIRTDRDRTNKLIEIKSKVAAAIKHLEDNEEIKHIPFPLQQAAELLASLTDT